MMVVGAVLVARRQLPAEPAKLALDPVIHP
jgi:hypothetical protein